MCIDVLKMLIMIYWLPMCTNVLRALWVTTIYWLPMYTNVLKLVVTCEISSKFQFDEGILDGHSFSDEDFHGSRGYGSR